MKIENSIGWCDETINAVTGCDKVSAGCRFCYAQVGTRARVLRGQGIETWGPIGVRAPVNFEPTFRRLNKLCICDGCHETYPFGFTQADKGLVNFDECSSCGCSLRRIRLFADSNSDWLDDRWPIETLARFLDAIRLAPNVDVQLLTKRIQGFNERLEAVLKSSTDVHLTGVFRFVADWLDGKLPANIWLGVSVEDQQRADERRQSFQNVPAATKFVSYEPALSHVLWSGWEFVDQIIFGGESGKNRRPCDVEWAVCTAKFCRENEIAFYCKQDVAFKSGQQGRIPNAIWSLKQFPKTL